MYNRADDSNFMVLPKTQTELLKKYPELDKKWETIVSVLEILGVVFFHQEKDTLLSLFSLGLRDNLFLDTQINLHPGGVIHITPSTVPMGSQINDFSKFLDVSLEEMMEIVPELDKRSYTRTTGISTNLERLQMLTEKGKYFFHSAKGRNFLATKIGISRQGKPRYRLYEVLAEQRKALTLVSPVF